MNDKISKYSAQFFSGVFNPLLIPSLGFLFIMGLIPGVEYFSLKLKMIILVVIFFSTCLIPLLFITLGKIRQGLNKEPDHYIERAMPYVFTSLSAFLGSQFLGKLPIPGIFRVFLLGICLTLIVASIIVLKWKLSDFTLALGGLLGALIALNFLFGMDVLWLIVGAILTSGVVGTSRIYLGKNTPGQVYMSFLAGMVCMFFVIAII